MLRWFCIAFIAAQLCTAQAGHNVLLIIADDYGADSSSLYNSVSNGASLPPTPNIAALAQSGVVFRNAYANPVCSPTRACILTGRHAFRHGIGDAITGPTSPTLAASEFTLPEAFAANAVLGYQLAQFGKWHLHNGPNSPNTIGGWPHFAGSLMGALASYTNWTKNVNGASTPNYTNYATSDNVDDAISWIQSRGTQPWLAWVAFNAGHTPLHKPPNHLHSYDSLPGTQMHINANPRLYYEAMIEAMDTEIGRLLSVVNRTNTHIIFLGDNGTPVQSLQSPYPSGRGKGTLYEGGIKVPFIIAGPAVLNSGRTNAALVHAVDLFSTILEMAGMDVVTTVPTNIAIDSQSLLPVLRNETDSSRCVYAELFGDNIANNQDGRTIRNNQFKLITFTDGREEFYDLGGDPYERTNLLSGQLTAIQQANYYSLTMRLGQFQDEIAAPIIVSWAQTAAQVSVTVQKSTNLIYALWRATTLDDLAWAPVTNATITTNQTHATLTDPSPPATAFYRVEASTP